MKILERIRKWFKEPSIEKPETHTLYVLGLEQSRNITPAVLHGFEKPGPITYQVRLKSSVTKREVVLCVSEEDYNNLFLNKIEFVESVKDVARCWRCNARFIPKP